MIPGAGLSAAPPMVRFWTTSRWVPVPPAAQALTAPFPSNISFLMGRCCVSHVRRAAPCLHRPLSRRWPLRPVSEGVSLPAPLAWELATPPHRLIPARRSAGDTAGASLGPAQTAPPHESPAGTPHNPCVCQQPESASERRQSCAARRSSARAASKFCAISCYRWRVAGPFHQG